MLKAPEAQWSPRLNLLSNAIVSQLWFNRLKIEIPPSPQPERASVLPVKGSAKKPVIPPTQGSAAPSPGSPVLVLEGSALMVSSGGAAPVSRYLQRLKEQPEFARWFRNVELKSAQQRQVEQEQVTDFVILLHPTGS
jgi:hypothetical protein